MVDEISEPPKARNLVDEMSVKVVDENSVVDEISVSLTYIGPSFMQIRGFLLVI